MSVPVRVNSADDLRLLFGGGSSLSSVDGSGNVLGMDHTHTHAHTHSSSFGSTTLDPSHIDALAHTHRQQELVGEGSEGRKAKKARTASVEGECA